jgi:hypothetical protein
LLHCSRSYSNRLLYNRNNALAHNASSECHCLLHAYVRHQTALAATKSHTKEATIASQPSPSSHDRFHLCTNMTQLSPLPCCSDNSGSPRLHGQAKPQRAAITAATGWSNEDINTLRQHLMTHQPPPSPYSHSCFASTAAEATASHAAPDNGLQIANTIRGERVERVSVNGGLPHSPQRAFLRSSMLGGSIKESNPWVLGPSAAS